MAPGSDRSLSRRDTALFLLCVVLSVGMLLRPELGASLTASIRGSVLRPFLWMQERAEQSRSGRSTFDRLRAERDSATYAAQFLPSLRAENQRLRAVLRVRAQLPGSYVAADVLHQSVPTDGRTLMLSVGREDGIRPFHAVVSATGLLGVIRSVDGHRSLAWTWMHPEFRASAFTVPAGVFGVVGPALQLTGSEQLLQLRGVAIRDTVPPGTLVVTSGLGGTYPRGIPVGTVIGLAKEDTGWERIYIIRPAAYPENAEQVLVLRGGQDSSLAAAFTTDSTP